MSDVLDALTLIIDNNDAGRYEDITQAAHDAVADVVEDREGFTFDSYRFVFNSGAARELHRAVGNAVADLLSDWLSEMQCDEWWKAILVDTLDLGSGTVRQKLGEHYLPEPDDVADLFANEDEDAGE